MNKCRISDLFEKYSRKKREALSWLLCYLYSFDTMKSEGECHPSTEFIAHSGKITRSMSTVKRYMVILEDMKLIKRSYPDGRKHVFHVTDTGKYVFFCRLQSAKYKTSSKTDLLINTNTYSSNNKHNTKDVEYIGLASKPEFTKTNLMILTAMIKKYTESESECLNLVSEIVYSIVSGRLMCMKNTGTYHSIPNAICIAEWLVKAGKWTKPNGYTDETLKGEKRMLNMTKFSCCKCGEPGKMFKNKHGASLCYCEDHYFENFKSIETEAMTARMVKEAARDFNKESIHNSKMTFGQLQIYIEHRSNPGKFTFEDSDGMISIKHNESPEKCVTLKNYDYTRSMLAAEMFIRGRHKALPWPQ